MEYTIRRLAKFETLFKRLARKAGKLGLTIPTFRIIRERVERAQMFELVDGMRHKIGEENVLVHDIEINGAIPVKLPGWNFAARCETVNGQDNLIFSVPGIAVPNRFQTSGSVCEHCNTRRTRACTYLVQHVESGEFKQVGSDCLANFMGHESAESIAASFAFYGEILSDLSALRAAELDGWEGGAAVYDLRYVVACSIETQAVHGWLSRAKAFANGGVATADRVKSIKPGECVVTEESYRKADAAIEFFASPFTDRDGEFAHNLHTLANAGFCSDKSYSLACALPVCHSAALNKAARIIRQQRQRATSQHVFKVGERVRKINAVIVAVFHYNTEWGHQTKTILEDCSGNVLVAKSLGTEAHIPVQFTATVKQHAEYDGIKQTVLVRAADIVFPPTSGV